MKNELTEHISNRDFVAILDLAQRSHVCTDEHTLKNLISDLNRLFYFENAFCGQCNLIELAHADEKIPVIHVCYVSYPKGFLDVYFENQDYKSAVDPMSWTVFFRNKL